MGKVYLVGAGPGAADLLTVRALRLLEHASIVFHDALVGEDVLALIKAPRVAVGKRCAEHSAAQHFINKRLIDAAARYPVVVRLKGGDPMLFGRAQEEIDALRQAGVEIEVIPGVSAAFAAAAEMQVSLTRRAVSRSVVFVTPRVGKEEDPSDWISSVLAADTAILYMAGHESARVAKALIDAGRSASWPVALVENVSRAERQVIASTLWRVAAGHDRCRSGAPTLLCMGDVFAVLEQLDAGILPTSVRA
jgi:uroporphyrin-III C-methyltransferase